MVTKSVSFENVKRHDRFLVSHFPSAELPTVLRREDAISQIRRPQTDHMGERTASPFPILLKQSTLDFFRAAGAPAFPMKAPVGNDDRGTDQRID